MRMDLVKRIIGIVGVLIAVLGAAAAVGGLIFALITLSFSGSAKAATGTVTGFVTEGGYRYPQIQYTPANSNTITIQANYSARGEEYKVGDKVLLLYDPASPQSARVNSFASLWAVPVTLGGIGGLLLVVWGVLELVQRRLPSLAMTGLVSGLEHGQADLLGGWSNTWVTLSLVGLAIGRMRFTAISRLMFTVDVDMGNWAQFIVTVHCY